MGGRYLLFTTAVFTCDEGFILVGPPVAFCSFDSLKEMPPDWFDILIETNLRPRCEGNKMRFFFKKSQIIIFLEIYVVQVLAPIWSSLK